MIEIDNLVYKNIKPNRHSSIIATFDMRYYGLPVRDCKVIVTKGDRHRVVGPLGPGQAPMEINDAISESVLMAVRQHTRRLASI